MTDHTSDDLLNQPEPGLADDPVVDLEASASLAEHFAQVATAESPELTGAPPRAQVRPEPQLIEKSEQPTPDPIEKLEQELIAVKRELALLKLAPAERYPEVLKDAEITSEEAHQILDCIIVQLKPWQERVKVTSNLYIVFQTRSKRHQHRLDEWAERTQPKLDTTVIAEALLNNMASSLVAYGDKVMKGDTEDARYEAAREFLESLPYAAYRLVQGALARFDAKINTVFSEGYLENF